MLCFFFFSSRRRHTRWNCDWSSDVCSSDLKLRDESESGARFEKYVDALASVIGHADRIGPLHDYCTGLILPGERKSVEPMAAKTDPSRMAAQHQSLLHFVG